MSQSELSKKLNYFSVHMCDLFDTFIYKNYLLLRTLVAIQYEKVFQTQRDGA